MSQEGSADPPFKHAPEGAHLLTRARYEQSFPGKSRRGSNSDSLSTWPRLKSEGTMDPSHAASGIDGGESVYSYDSARDLSAHFRELNGRRFTQGSNPYYMLPFDETEFWRLDKQHAAFLCALGDLYACPDLVENVLAPRPGEVIEMVDLGCGTATWALSMARRFPHVQVLGVDLAPVPINPDLLTPNIRFEIDDINLGLPHLAGRFDLVHMRCASGGLPDYPQAITTAAQCLKPGGLLLIVDFDMHLLAEDMLSSQKMASAHQPNGSWVQRFCYEFRWAYQKGGIPIFSDLLDKGLWEHPLLEGCGAGAVHIPLGPWAKSDEPEEAQRLQFSGILLRQNISNALVAIQTMMKRNGIPQNVLDEWTAKCLIELDSLNNHSWAYLRLLWGQRKHDDARGVPESSPEGSMPTSRPSQPRLSTWQPHKQVRIYNTLEESQAARQHRVDTLGELVEPYVLSSD